MTRQIAFIKALILFGLTLLSTLILTNCREPEPIAPGVLKFDRDSLKFDTIFTTLPSPTQRLMITNTTNHPVIIEKIAIQGGNASEFTLTFDGIVAQEHKNYELAAGDSVWALVKMKAIKQQDYLSSDYLTFSSGNFQTKIPLQAEVYDAFFLSDSIIDRDTTFTKEKRYVIDGIFYVPEGRTVVFEAGCQFYFTSRRREIVEDNDPLKNSTMASAILVSGKLEVNGDPNDPVLFTNFRFGKDYDESPGQWYGIVFLKESQDSYIENAIIKNATIGIRVDSISIIPNQLKVRLTNIQIRNMEYHGLLGLGFDEGKNPFNNNYSILAQNLLITECKGHAAAFLGGGFYKIINCTFANFRNDFGRNLPSVAANNYLKISDVEYKDYPLKFESTNNIIWGNDEEELAVELLKDIPSDVLISNNIIKNKKEDFNGNDNILNQNPEFVDVGKRDYKLKENSPAINKGLDDAGIRAINDLAGVRRYDITIDIGCYEYKP